MRDPAYVPEELGCSDVRAGLDSDADGRPDSIFTSDGDDLLLHTDLDADGLADRSWRLHSDGSISAEDCDAPSGLTILLRWWGIR